MNYHHPPTRSTTFHIFHPRNSINSNPILHFSECTWTSKKVYKLRKSFRNRESFTCVCATILRMKSFHQPRVLFRIRSSFALRKVFLLWLTVHLVLLLQGRKSKWKWHRTQFSESNSLIPKDFLQKLITKNREKYRKKICSKICFKKVQKSGFQKVI